MDINNEVYRRHIVLVLVLVLEAKRSAVLLEDEDEDDFRRLHGLGNNQ